MCEVRINNGLGGVYHAKSEHKNCRIFKTLLSNDCSFDCKYCSNAHACKKTRTSYEPKELASLFDYLHKNLAVVGLFLSSSVAGNPDSVTEKMIETVRLLRNDYNFYGYVHFKVLPGTSYELIRQASEISDRMSINIEAPNKQVLNELSSCKDYKIDILRRQAWISKFKLASGQTTQMIVNDYTTDKDVLRMSAWEYGKLKLRRVYYSAFAPLKGTPLENENACSLTRQNHLYNADFLLRTYGYELKELDSIMQDGMLPNIDPKMAFAMAFNEIVDVNEASYDELIRVPGIGPKTAGNIMKCNGKIGDYQQLRKLGCIIKRAAPFIKVNGRRQTGLKEF